MITNSAVKKALNQTAYALAQVEFVRIRARLAHELEVAQSAGAGLDDLLALLRRRIHVAGGCDLL